MKKHIVVSDFIEEVKSKNLLKKEPELAVIYNTLKTKNDNKAIDLFLQTRVELKIF